jgi:imidazolonepropionase-like amidohydrolase
VLVVQRGKIIAVGAAKDVPLPEGTIIHDVTGKTIIPGLVDTHSHIGIYPKPSVPAHSDGNEMSGPVQPGIRAIDAIYPDDPGIRMATAGGVTTANIMPGSGNVIGGQTLYVKLRGKTVEAMRVFHPNVIGGLKMANGENPKGYGRRGNQAPGTRMKVAALQREQFVKAREYQRKWKTYQDAKAAGKETPQPESDLAMETLVEVLDRKRTVHFHCHRADDIMTAVRLAEEFEFEVVLQHATEAYRVAEELAKRKIPVSLTLVDSPGGKLETAALLEENAAILEKAGVPVAINTDDSITESRFYLRTGAIAVRGGMSEDAALKALTINPARMMHLDDRLGSLEKDKSADFVILSGPPFSVYTHVLETHIDGERVFDRNSARDWPYQVGGFALADRERLPKLPELIKPLDDSTTKVKLPAPEKPPEKPNPGSLFIHAGRVHPVASPPITDAAIVVEDGKIAYVGPRKDAKAPEGATILTAREVTPGLIDAHTVVGISGKFNIPADQDQDELSDPNQADLRVLDAFNPNEPLLEFFREHGVTVVHATPGRTNVIAGQSGIFRTQGRAVEQMTIRFPAALLVNLGEIPKQTHPGKLTTRMGTAGLVRTALTQAKNHAEKLKTVKDEEKRPGRNLKLEALEPVLAGKLPVYFSAHRADDINTALRLTKEFNLKTVLDHANEGYLMLDGITSAQVPVVVHPTMQRASTMELFNTHLGNAAALANAKIPIAMGTGFEGYVPKTRVLRHEAAMAMVNGLGHDRALRAITLDAAKLLNIAGDYGSIEKGKMADLVLYDGDPFEHATHVTHTVIGGRVVFDRGEYLKIPFGRRALPLIGGEGVGCCMGAW